MRKLFAAAGIVFAAVTFGIGLGRSAGLSSPTLAESSPGLAEYGYVQIAYEQDDALDGRNCPHRQSTESETTDV